MISKNSLLLFTTIHPYGEKFLAQLIKNINEQTYQNFKVFFCFNNLKIKKKHLKEINKLRNKFIILKTNLPPVKSRIITLKKIIKYNFNIIIFLDCDDLMHKKRIAIIIGGTSDIGYAIIERLIRKYEIIFSYNKSFSYYPNSEMFINI